MKKNRYMLCLLLSGFMLYVALPRVSMYAAGMEGVFAIGWLVFAIMVIAGNLTGILHSPQRPGKKAGRPNPERNRKKIRFYDR